MNKNTKKFYKPEDFETTENKETVNTTSNQTDEIVVEAVNDNLNDDRVVVEVTCPKLNIRSAPEGTASIFGVFSQGTKFHLIEDEHPTFYKIITESGLIGYAMKEFLKVVS